MFASGPMPVADLAGPTVEFSPAPSSAPSVDLSQPSVVGQPGGPGQARGTGRTEDRRG